jgi:hypothetical protein
VADDTPAAEAYIDTLDEPRRSQMRHLHDVILAAVPGIDVSLLDYSGPIIGYGSYEYSNSKGPAGTWFSIGLASRKRYISLYSMGMKDGGYLVDKTRDRFPGTKAGKSCINISRPEKVSDEAVTDLVRETWDQYKNGFQRPQG